MAEIYICGHRNPDMDSVCSALALARLKNLTDPDNHYIPIRCGHLTAACRNQLERLGVEPPMFKKDLKIRLHHVIKRPMWSVASSDPIYTLISIFNDNQPSVVPILDKGKYKGLVSIDDMNNFFFQESTSFKPFYNIQLSNFEKVMRGYFIKKGRNDSFQARLSIGAMSFDVFKQYFDDIPKENLPILVVGDRKLHIEEAIRRQVPALIITGNTASSIADRIDFSQFQGSVFVSEHDTADTIRLLRLSQPVSTILKTYPPHMDINTLFDDAKKELSASAFRGFPVFDGDEWKGFVTRRCFLEKPKDKLIMVDHNEVEQAIGGVDEAEIVGIVDHHRFGTTKTKTPIFISSEALGSTCTLVYNLYRRWNVEIDKETALILLSGLVSDTVILKSPTTTVDDRIVAKELCRLGEVDNLTDFGTELFSTGESLREKNSMDVIESDFKIYDEKGIRFGIGQCEVITLKDFESYKDSFLKNIKVVAAKHALKWGMIMITDVIKESSVLITTGYDELEKNLVYEEIEENIFALPEVLSRKKQLLPEILRVINEKFS